MAQCVCLVLSVETVVPVRPDAAAASAATDLPRRTSLDGVPSRPEHQQEPPGGSPHPEEPAGKLAGPTGSLAQAQDVGRRAPAAPRRSLYDVVVVQLVQHRQLAQIGPGRLRGHGALGGRGEESLRLAPPVLLVGLGHIYAVALEELGTLQGIEGERERGNGGH